MTTIAAIKSEIADLNAKARAHRMSHNDGGEGYNPYTDKIIDACSRLRSAELADYASRWDSLRAAWNAAVAKYSTGGQVDMRSLSRIEAEVGITLSDLRAVKTLVEG